MVIFSAVILGLAGLSFHVARRSTRSVHQTHMLSQLNSLMDRAVTVEYDSLSTIAGCDTLISSAVRIVGCTTVTPVSASISSVRVVVSTSVPGTRPDTVVFQRGKERRPVPLK